MNHYDEEIDEGEDDYQRKFNELRDTDHDGLEEEDDIDYGDEDLEQAAHENIE